MSPESVRKWRTLSLVVLAELLAISLWMSGSAVVPQLALEWGLSAAAKSWMTMSVQVGFVLGALLFAISNLADRVSARKLFAVSALFGALFNAAIPLLEPSLGVTLVFRFLTGVTLAGIYPPAMKLVATWCREDRGLGIGILVGALTLGKGVPHLLNGLPWFGDGGMPPWRSILYATSVQALAASLIAALFIRSGPFLSKTAPFDWKYALKALRHAPTRLANFGYLGHMWELYAMWVWVPLMILASYEAAGWSRESARIAGFAAIASGALGSVVAGVLADRIGRTTVTSLSLAVSGACCLFVGFFFGSPGMLTAVCILWGAAVVADSAQFSAAVSELGDPRYVGTALTLQTSLGFLLTLVSIGVIPPLVDGIGWAWAFPFLAPGPAFGIWSMLRLRRLPDATKMASGHR